ncbi:exodeoxyribonuclease VII small subunit [Streptacidiphilus sp. P02-A3a]|uniref:exodeoxyribonuclease VII small subunit n=1 Tax=Streptacidiphilus sp. P02-A3a TaxID=2704468 RepID=UPI0015FA49C9|nr:exodeoxyribonuclease VII small subunit [Streptacidiphilus sp. P02-A3a]QMU67684.1 exodeoxyribonuclease VII small subunit [Streptacidiphilus sp. P02-A3a]
MTKQQESDAATAVVDDALGYEQARDALLDVVRRLETGGVSLEESLALWERGEQLAKVCERWLDGARARLDAALAEGGDADGSAGDEGDAAED